MTNTSLEFPRGIIYSINRINGGRNFISNVGWGLMTAFGAWLSAADNSVRARFTRPSNRRWNGVWILRPAAGVYRLHRPDPTPVLGMLDAIRSVSAPSESTSASQEFSCDIYGIGTMGDDRSFEGAGQIIAAMSHVGAGLRPFA
jgi:hypothetical protein